MSKYENKQNFRIWIFKSEQDQQVFNVFKKVIFRCLCCVGIIIGLNFFETDINKAITINTESYGPKISTSFRLYSMIWLQMICIIDKVSYSLCHFEYNVQTF